MNLSANKYGYTLYVCIWAIKISTPLTFCIIIRSSVGKVSNDGRQLRVVLRACRVFISKGNDKKMHNKQIKSPGLACFLITIIFLTLSKALSDSLWTVISLIDDCSLEPLLYLLSVKLREWITRKSTHFMTFSTLSSLTR